MTKPTPAEREAAVLAVLKNSAKPVGPSEIGRRIGQSWCCYQGDNGEPSMWGQSSSITPVLRRIGAVRHKGGLYTKPETQA